MVQIDSIVTRFDLLIPSKAEAKKTFKSLTDDERMNFEERAAIMEYDGELSRVEAERRALEIVLRCRRR